jgi:hypothetical protein
MFMLMFMVFIIMVVVVVVLGAMMRLVFHIQPQNSAEWRFATGDRDDRGVVMEMRLNGGARPLDTDIIKHVCLGHNDQIRCADLVLEKLIDRAVMIKLLIGSTLPLKGFKIMRDAATSQRRTIDKRDHPIQHDLCPDVGPAKGLHKRLRQSEAGCFDDDMIRWRILRQQRLDAWQEIIGDRTADTPIRQLDYVIDTAAVSAAFRKHRPIHPDIAKFIDDQGQPFAIRLRDDVTDQGGFTGSQKPGNHRCWDTCGDS